MFLSPKIQWQDKKKKKSVMNLITLEILKIVTLWKLSNIYLEQPDLVSTMDKEQVLRHPSLVL